MAEKKATRRCCNNDRAEVSARDTEILADFERGCQAAGWLLFGMFALMSVWSVIA